MPQQKLKVYQHAIVWSSGEVSLGGGVAFDPGGAGAFAMMAALRGGAPPAADAVPTGVRVIELSADWLRQALRVIETGTGTASVLSLVKGAEPEKPSEEFPPFKPAYVPVAEAKVNDDSMPATTEEPQWTDWLRRQQALRCTGATRGLETPEQEPAPPVA